MIFVLIIQVFKRLQKLLLCLSHKRSIAYVDKLGASHDAKVLQWKLRLEDVLFGSQNLIAELIDSAENAGVVSGFNPDGEIAILLYLPLVKLVRPLLNKMQVMN